MCNMCLIAGSEVAQKITYRARVRLTDIGGIIYQPLESHAYSQVSFSRLSVVMFVFVIFRYKSVDLFRLRFDNELSNLRLSGTLDLFD